MEPRDFEDSGRMRYGAHLLRDVDDKLPVGAIVHRGAYRIEGLLGRGGMALVYAARRMVDGGEVALKIIRAKYAKRTDLAYRLHNEVDLARALEGHPNIVRALEVGLLSDLGGVPFMVTELVAGPPLTSEIIQVPYLPTLRACRITRDLSLALEVMAKHGIVHRDVKPDNVILANERTETETAKLIDFGLASRVRAPDESSRRVTEVHERPGTRLYMAPEQAVGAPASPTMDVYALGCTFYEMLMGSPPYGHRTDAEVMERKVGGDQPEFSIAEDRRDLPPAVASLVDACLVRDPSKRITAAVLRERLDEVIAELGGIGPREVTEIVVPRAAPVVPAPTAAATASSETASSEQARTGVTVVVPTPSVEPLPPGASTRAEALARIAELEGSGPSLRATNRGDDRRSHGVRAIIVLAVAAAALAVAAVLWPRGPEEMASPGIVDPHEIMSAAAAPEAPLVVPVPSRDEAPRPDEVVQVAAPRGEPMSPTIVPPAAPGPSSAVPVRPSDPAPVDPGKVERVKPHVAATPPADPAMCERLRQDAKASVDERAWGDVLKHTASRKCWPKRQQRQELRVRALAGLQRWADCVAEGGTSDDPLVQPIVALCRKRAQG